MNSNTPARFRISGALAAMRMNPMWQIQATAGATYYADLPIEPAYK